MPLRVRAFEIQAVAGKLLRNFELENFVSRRMMLQRRLQEKCRCVAFLKVNFPRWQKFKTSICFAFAETLTLVE